MRAQGTMEQWYRFLDVRSDDEAACEARRLANQLHDSVVGLDRVMRRLSYAPDTELDAMLRIANTSIGDAVSMLMDVAERFREPPWIYRRAGCLTTTGSGVVVLACR